MPAFESLGLGKVDRHLNSRREEVTIPAKSAKCGLTFLLGRDALALPRTLRPNSVAIVRDAATSAAA
jgi:hypothetical protein